MDKGMIIHAEFVHETEKAICIKHKNAIGKWWLPKSQIDWQADLTKGKIIWVEIPLWLAKKQEIFPDGLE